MKNVTMAAFLLTLITGFAMAQERPDSSNATTEVQLAQESKIEMNDVPSNVKVALNKTAYKSKDVTEVFELTAGDDKFYKFILNTNSGQRAVTFDANGTMTQDKAHNER